MRRAFDSRTLFPLLFGRVMAFQLDVQPDASGEVPEHKYIHVASTGLYKGHWQGEFDLTPQVFASFVKNLRSHPQFTLGEVPVDGKTVQAGSKPTIQFDYEHASEMPPTEGEIPNKGAEAPAWVLDLDVRPGDEGEQKLYALAWLGQQIRDQIKRNAYRQTSIAFDMDARDWKTGEPCGPALTSIAFTNKPFLKQLESYAAANRGQAARRRAANTDPPTQDPPPAATNPEPQRTTMTTAAAPAQTIDWQQIHVTFKANICRRLGTRVLAEDAAIEDAAGEAAASGSTLSKLLTALGVNDAESGLKVIPEFRKAREDLAGALQELDEMLSGQAAMDTAIENADVAAVMTAKKLPLDGVDRLPLLSFRKSCIEESVRELTSAYRRRLSDDKARVPVNKILEARKEGRDKFLKHYGLAADGVDRSNLLTSFASTKNGKQLTPPALTISDDARSDGNDSRETVDLRGCSGRNPIEKVINHLSAKDPAFAKLTHYDRVKQASAFASSHQLVTS